MNFMIDGADIEFTVTELQGTPLVVLQGTGPTMSAMATTSEFTDLRVRTAYDVGNEITRIMIYDGAEGIVNPLLSAAPDPMFNRLHNIGKTGSIWVLALQFMLNDSPVTRMWSTEGKESSDPQVVRTKSLKLPGRDEGILDYWICKLV